MHAEAWRTARTACSDWSHCAFMTGGGVEVNCPSFSLVVKCQGWQPHAGVFLSSSAGTAWPSTPLPHSRLLSSAGTPPALPSRSRDLEQDTGFCSALLPRSARTQHKASLELVFHSQPLGTSTGNNERNKHWQDSVWLVCSWPRGLAPLAWELNTFWRAGAPGLPL